MELLADRRELQIMPTGLDSGCGVGLDAKLAEWGFLPRLPLDGWFERCLSLDFAVGVAAVFVPRQKWTGLAICEFAVVAVWDFPFSYSHFDRH